MSAKDIPLYAEWVRDRNNEQLNVISSASQEELLGAALQGKRVRITVEKLL